MNDVWTVIHAVHRGGNDVAVASMRVDDPDEWERAYFEALKNEHACAMEVQRWRTIAEELMIGWRDADVRKARDEGAGL